MTAAGLALLLMVAACSGQEQQPAPDGDVPVEYARKTILEACVALHSCGLRRGAIRVSECMLHYERVIMLGGLTGLHKGLHLCALQARGDCSKVQACLGVQDKDGECSSSYPGGCDGEVARYCESGDKKIVRLDCKAAGLTCHTDRDGHPFCGVGACSKDGDKICQGTVLKTCAATGWQVEHCELYDFGCGLDRDKLTNCIGTGKECGG